MPSQRGSRERPSFRLDQRNPRLDGIRGLAILLLMFYHLTLYGSASSWFDRALVFIPSLSWTSPDLFFVLSGFLITSILVRAKGSAHYFRSFYGRRVLRIFPLYYAVLFFFFFVLPALPVQAELWSPGSDRETIWYWLYLANIKVALTGEFQHHFLSIAWTLAIEEHFYLVWPLVVSVLSRRSLVRVCIGLMIGAFLLRCAMLWFGAPVLAVFTFTLCRVDPIAAGSLIALLATDPRAAERLRRLSGPGLLVAGALFLACVYAANRMLAVELPGPGQGYDAAAARPLVFTRSALIQTIGYSLSWIFYASLMIRTIAARDGSPLDRFFSSSVMTHLGKYSYAMYLLHIFAAEVVRNVFEPTRSELPFVVKQFLFWALSFGLTYLFALATWYGLEVHVLRLKRLFVYETAEPTQPEASATGAPNEPSYVGRPFLRAVAIVAMALPILVFGYRGTMWALYRHALAVPVNGTATCASDPPGQDERRVVVVGDSIVHGSISFDVVASLDERLGSQGFQFINAGTPGDTANDVFERIDEVIACEPDFVVLMIGTNDARAWLRSSRANEAPDFAGYEDSIRRILTRLDQETRAQIVLVSIPMVGEDGGDRANRLIARANQFLRGFEAQPRVTYVPLFTAMGKAVYARPGGMAGASCADGRDYIDRSMFQHFVFGQSLEEIAVGRGFLLTTDCIHLGETGGHLLSSLIESQLRAIDAVDRGDTSGTPRSREAPDT